MILIYVRVQTAQELRDTFERTLRDVVGAARQSAGCLKYQWYREPDSHSGYVIYGEFSSRQHFEDYLRSDVVRRIGEELMPLLSAEPEFKHYEATLFEGN